MTAKTKRTVSLDADLVAALGEGNLSAEVNQALRDRLDERARHEKLARFLDEEVAAGAVLDEAEVQHYIRLLGGGEDAALAS